jgi:DNA-binding NtrC family response regulator
MDGLQFVRYVSGKWPPIRVIATSGHFIADEVDLPDGGVFLSKPYSADRIIDAIRECTGMN